MEVSDIENISKMLKPPLTFEKQLEKLINEKNIIIKNKKHVLDFLKHNNYYQISGYIHLFRNEKIEFEYIKNIMIFDSKFSELMMYIISTIEKSIKTNLAYYFAHNYEYGNISYLDKETFMPQKILKKLMKNIKIKEF